MNVKIADLPREVREAYLAWAAQPGEVQVLEKIGAMAAVVAIVIIDHPNGNIYTTRDCGQSFEAGKIAETIQFREDQPGNEGIVVRRVLRISKTGNGG